jgi:hypothetical protein
LMPGPVPIRKLKRTRDSLSASVVRREHRGIRTALLRLLELNGRPNFQDSPSPGSSCSSSLRRAWAAHGTPHPPRSFNEARRARNRDATQPSFARIEVPKRAEVRSVSEREFQFWIRPRSRATKSSRADRTSTPAMCVSSNRNHHTLQNPVHTSFSDASHRRGDRICLGSG